MRRLVLLGVTVLVASARIYATVPPRTGEFPPLVLAALRARPDLFSFKTAFMPLVNAVRLNQRAQLLSAGRGGAAPAIPGAATAVAGTRRLPMLPIQFSDASAEPFSKGQLQSQVFDGPAGLTAYYKAVSYQKLTLSANVFDWTHLSRPERDYLGPSGCYAKCLDSKIANLVVDALGQNPQIDWSAFDNDGPDGIPNSGDDDGLVDVLTIIQPTQGGECMTAEHAWSQQGTLSNWTGNRYTTTTPRRGGGFIQIDDFIVAPARSCQPGKIIEFGVYAHELGHAFGLPDLYSLRDGNKSLGPGLWCLMSVGVYGGDPLHQSDPAHPTSLSAWAKAFLGWITVRPVPPNAHAINLDPIETTPIAYIAPIDDQTYYLIERRRQLSVDAGLPGAGLLILKIDDEAVKRGLVDNSVNDDPLQPGVVVVQADSLVDLQAGTSWGKADDLFRNPPHQQVDGVTPPVLEGRLALCNLVGDGSPVDLGFGNCPLPLPGRGGRGAAPVAPPPPNDNSLSRPLEVLGQGVNTLMSHAEAYMGVTVTLRADVVNAGTNYFTDRRLELRDPGLSTGLSARVQAPLSVVPAQQGRGSDSAPIVSQGRSVTGPAIVTGHVERVVVEGVTRFVFVVTSARSVR